VRVTISGSNSGNGSLISTAVRAAGAGVRISEMMIATNFVVATRMEMIGKAVRNPLDGNYRELNLMVPEKVTAISRSGAAWFEGVCQLQRDMAEQMVDIGMLLLGGVPKPSRLVKLASDSTRRGARVLLFPVTASDAALEPLHRTVTVNARRLRGDEARRAA
jgi:hypothetical protein